MSMIVIMSSSILFLRHQQVEVFLPWPLNGAEKQGRLRSLYSLLGPSFMIVRPYQS